MLSIYIMLHYINELLYLISITLYFNNKIHVALCDQTIIPTHQCKFLLCYLMLMQFVNHISVIYIMSMQFTCFYVNTVYIRSMQFTLRYINTYYFVISM